MSAVHKLEVEPRLVVALATHAGRIQSQVRAFLSGPGREQFVISDTARAQVLIADYDNDPSRDVLHAFLLMGRGPAIVLAMADPGIPGTWWVPKPVREQDLLLASQVIWNRLVHRGLPMPVLESVQPPAPERPALRLLPRPEPLPVTQLPVRHHPPGRALIGPFRETSRSDWTSSIVWIALGALLIAALVSMLGWRPANQVFRPPTQVAMVDTATDRSMQELRRAIGLAIQAMPTPTPEQQAQLAADVAEVQRLSGAVVDTAGLARLTLGVQLPDVSRRALPVEQMADAAEPWQEQAGVRSALFVATRDRFVDAGHNP